MNGLIWWAECSSPYPYSTKGYGSVPLVPDLSLKGSKHLRRLPRAVIPYPGAQEAQKRSQATTNLMIRVVSHNRNAAVEGGNGMSTIRCDSASHVRKNSVTEYRQQHLQQGKTNSPKVEPPYAHTAIWQTHLPRGSGQSLNVGLQHEDAIQG